VTLDYFEGQVRESTALLAARRASQLDHALLGDNSADCGFLRYAIGMPLARVRDAFAGAAQAYAGMYERRGTQPALPTYGMHYVTEVGRLSRRSLARSSPKMDDSLAHPRRGILAMCLGLVINNRALSERVAWLIGDRADQTAASPASDVRAWNERCIERALKMLLRGDPRGAHPRYALAELRDIQLTGDLTNYQAMLLRELAAGDVDHAANALALLLRAHEQQAQWEENVTDPAFFICMTGLAACALYPPLLQHPHLPRNNVYLPLALLQGNGTPTALRRGDSEDIS
jgi:hypothetical protein